MNARVGTLASTALAHPGKDVRASSWRAHYNETANELRVYHYSTRMLFATRNADGSVYPIDIDTGWGSVTDQQGMNQIFKDLRIPLKMRRDERGGGPRFETVG